MKITPEHVIRITKAISGVDDIGRHTVAVPEVRAFVAAGAVMELHCGVTPRFSNGDRDLYHQAMRAGHGDLYELMDSVHRAVVNLKSFWRRERAMRAWRAAQPKAEWVYGRYRRDVDTSNILPQKPFKPSTWMMEVMGEDYDRPGQKLAAE